MLYKLRCCKRFPLQLPHCCRKVHSQCIKSTKIVMIYLCDCRFVITFIQLPCEVRWERNWPPRCSLQGGVGGYTFSACYLSSQAEGKRFGSIPYTKPWCHNSWSEWNPWSATIHGGISGVLASWQRVEPGCRDPAQADHWGSQHCCGPQKG